MKHFKENTGIRENPAIHLNTSGQYMNTISTSQNYFLEKNSNNRNFRNTINLNNTHNTINLLTPTNTQVISNSVISTYPKTPKSVNDYENSLNLINFKLNCDILQNKINRLNSLIPNNNYDLTNYTPLNSERVGATTAKNFSKFHHRRNDVKILNDASSGKDYLNIMINNTKERINECLNKTQGTKGFRLNTESDNTGTYNPTLTYTKSGIVMYDSENSKQDHSLSYASQLEKSDFLANLNELNSASKKKNSKFKGNHLKDLYIDTSISKIDLFTESVQQFCITPTPTNMCKDLKFNNTGTFSGNNYNSINSGSSLEFVPKLKLDNLQEDKKNFKDNIFYNSKNDKILIENQNADSRIDEFILENIKNNKNYSSQPPKHQHLEIHSFSSENPENQDNNESKSVNLSELADDLLELKEVHENQENNQNNNNEILNELKKHSSNASKDLREISQNEIENENENSQLNFEKNIDQEEKDISDSLSLSESRNNSPKKPFSSELSRNESQNEIPLSEDELMEGLTPRSLLRKKLMSKEHPVKTNSNSDNMNYLNSVPLQNDTSANGRKSRNNTNSYNELNVSKSLSNKSANSEKLQMEENGFTPSDKDQNHHKTLSCEEDREASLLINEIIQKNKSEPSDTEENEVSECKNRKRVTFARDDIVIIYREKDLIQHLYLVKEDGQYVRHKRKDFNIYIKQLKSKRRPKSIITRLSLNLQEKEMALQKLNNLIVECDEDSSCEKTSQYKYPKAPTEISKKYFF
jgi:hypothetical protein